MSRSRFRLMVLLVIAFVQGSVGCSGRAFYPVSGKLFVDGKPGTGVLVVLRSVDEAEPIQPSAVVDAEGCFAVKSFVHEDHSLKDGAPAGKYLVSCAWYPEDLQKYLAQEKLPDKLRHKYSNPKTSGLTIEVEERPTELRPFELSTR